MAGNTLENMDKSSFSPMMQKYLETKEKYKDYTREDIDRLYRDKENLATNLKFIKENNKKTLAQVFTDVRYKKEDNEYFSEVFLKIIKEQGFRF